MNCPNCGKKIAKGMLLCSYCGYEMQLIPDFDPEIDQEINDGLSDLDMGLIAPEGTEEYYAGTEGYYPEGEEYYPGTEEYYPEEPEEDVQLYVFDSNGRPVPDQQPYAEEELDDFDEEYDGIFDDDDFDDDEDVMHQIWLLIKASRFRWIIIPGLLVLVLVIVLLIMNFSKKLLNENSQSFQLEKAKAAADAGEYSEAVGYMEKALSIDSGDTSLKFTLVDYYFKDGQDENALLMLWEIINAKDMNSAMAYRRMIEYYNEKGDYAMIEDILNKCEDESILSQFGEFTARAPEFSEPPGVYGGTLWLKLSASPGGNIYYTLDGSMPSASSELYTAPIFLDLGIVTVKAVFINSFGTSSPVAEGTYTIDILKPDAPVVTPAGGEFTEPQLISVEAQKFCHIYYTTDGRMPTNESSEYLSPIPMPLGRSHIIFVAYSQDNVPGDIAEYDYELSVEGEVDAQSFINVLRQYNVNTGRTSDLEGHLPGSMSRYDYSVGAAMRFNEVDYYLITENVVDISDSSIKSGSFYLGDMNSGAIYKAIRNEEDLSFSMGEQLPPDQLAAPAPVLDPEAED
ncbi:MAG: chitobiase/beta-hexosaminidase C-terminal domain-containing protein [Lachnospiraceae bacterium]|nr:chitobiase/beta-hexosaminidase C-terminal domain-containing protein [Lachnospiraceae bacterium]